MLPQQGHLLLSSYTDLYDLIIPKDHLLRKMKELVDFSFVREELANKYCLDNGRMAVDPVCMFKYLLLKTIYNLSDVDIVERARVDMSFKYFLDMVPEADVINPSSLTKFRRLRLKDMDLLDLLINKTVSLAIDKGIIKATYTTLIIDATHTASRSNPCRPIEVLKMRSRELRKSLYAIDEEIESSLPEKNTDDDLEHEISYSQRLIDHLKENEVLSHIPLIKEKLNLLRESLDDIADRYTTSVDSDARVGHKSKESSFFGFKTHLAITQERLITGAVITSGEKSDGEQLAALIEQSEKNGVKVDTVIADTAYSGIDNLKLTKEKEIDLISKLNPTISYGSRKEEDKFFYNKDAGMFVCPAGHMAVRMQRKYRGNQKDKKKRNDRLAYFFDIQKCKVCSIREGCYKPGSKSKMYSVTIKTKEQDEQLAFQETDAFKEKYRDRYKIEAKNAELKQVHGYDRAISYGLAAMNMQGALTIFASNLKRIIKLS